MSAYTYLLMCADGTLYCGWTTDPQRRLSEHNAGSGSKYTRSRRPLEMVFLEQWNTKQEAMRREAEIKSLSRKKKLEMILKYEKNMENNAYSEIK